MSNFTNTTSNYISGIDSEYPVAGQDNDSQGFRNNFTNISLALTSINGDVTDLQVNTVKINQTNNFGDNVIQQAQFQNCSVSIYDDTATAKSGDFTVNYSNGSFQKFALDRGTHNITLSNLPSSDKSGSLFLELSADTSFNTYINFISTSLINLSSDDLPYQITQDNPFIIEVISDGVSGNLFVKKLNDQVLTATTFDINSTNITGTNIYAVSTFHISSNTYTINDNLETVIANESYTGRVALLQNQVYTNVASIYVDIANTSTTTSTFMVTTSTGIIVGAEFGFVGTNTVFTVESIDGEQIFTQNFEYTQVDVNDGDLLIFTNPTFPNQPKLLFIRETAPPSISGSPGDLKGSVYINSEELWVANGNYQTSTSSWVRISSDTTPRTLVAGTAAFTPEVTANNSLLATTAFVHSIMPYGTIIMWSGSEAATPSGWALCDGTGGTPNLTDRFVIGAGNTYAVNATGGSANAVVVSHTHLFTGTALGTHFHGSGVASGGGGGSYYTANGSPEVNQISTQAVSAGTPAGTNSTEGVSGTNANLPPYYALCYIMKTTGGSGVSINPPIITGIDPATGGTGTSVVIAGYNFNDATQVTFGATTSTFVADSDTQITATAPAGGTGIVSVLVTNPVGVSVNVNNNSFNYNAIPVITSISPGGSAITGGGTLTIIGFNFVGVTDVSLGATTATFTITNQNQILATIPAVGASETDYVTVTNGIGTNTTGTQCRFTYVSGVPSVTGITPTSGGLGGGMSVFVAGTNMLGASRVNFGTNTGTYFSISSDNLIVAQSPSTSTSGVVDITVVNPLGTSTVNANDKFTYVSTPVVSTVSPVTSFVLSQTITVSGNNFANITGIQFINVDNPSLVINAGLYTVNNTGQITVVAPSTLSIDVAYDIVVTNNQGSSNTSVNDRYSVVTDYNQYYNGGGGA